MSDALPPWPEATEGAVSLTFDDGMACHLDRAIPILEERGLRGSFFVHTRGDDFERRLAPWKDVAARGHEVGNHSNSHPCSCNTFGRAEGLDTMTLEEMEADILEAERRLNACVGEWPRSYCYPCYDTHVGRGVDKRSYVPVVAKHFIAGRGQFHGRHHVNYHAVCDLALVGSHPCERMAAHEMIGLCEMAAAKGEWTVLTFHGIETGHLSVPEREFVALCDHLAKHRARIWTAPLYDVAKAIELWCKK